MPDFILIDGDEVIFHPAFTPAMVSVRPGKLEASGAFNRYYAAEVAYDARNDTEPLLAGVNGKRICIERDAEHVEVKDCPYVTPLYSIPGKGTLKISTLAPDQKTVKDRLSHDPMLLKGTVFEAKFEVTLAAKLALPGPGAPQEDPVPYYRGTGVFKTANTTQKAT
jgi:hypothetical protein